MKNLIKHYKNNHKQLQSFRNQQVKFIERINDEIGSD